ncbi:MAG: hypothetical protein AB1632_07985 [Nitrospirota bacterium]
MTEVYHKDNERRRLKRDLLSMPVIYAYFSERQIKTSIGTSFDLNVSGMSFYADTLLQEGLNLQVLVSKLWDYPRSSTVRWCSKTDSSHYRVGISFR